MDVVAGDAKNNWVEKERDRGERERERKKMNKKEYLNGMLKKIEVSIEGRL